MKKIVTVTNNKQIMSEQVMGEESNADTNNGNKL